MIEYICPTCKQKDRPDYLCDFCGGLGFISEIYDAEPPHHPHGCPAQAWSTAEILRAWALCAGINGIV